jgi:hypothetical protein
MDATPFDHLSRSLVARLTRRTLAGLIGLSVVPIPHPGDAKGKHTHNNHPKMVKFNDFDCVNVGGLCKHDGQCCSGICQGKKHKRRCRAHDQRTCHAGQIEGFCGGEPVSCVTGTGDTGSCDTTTGKAGYCTASGNCFACSKDADCVPFCGAHAACIVCGNVCALSDLQTACVGPVAGGCRFPA